MGAKFLHREYLRSETDTLIISTKNYCYKINYIKTKVYTAHNSKYWLCVDRDETVNLIISQRNKLAKSMQT